MDAALEDHAHPARHVADGRTDAAGRRLRVRLALILRLEAVADTHMSHRVVRPLHEIAEARAGNRHAEWCVKRLLRQGRPFGVRCHRDRLCSRCHSEVGIRVVIAERVQFRKAQATQHLFAVIAKIFQLIACVVRQAGTMRIHIGDRHMAGDPVIAQGEPREMRRDGRIPGDQAETDLVRHHRCTDRLGQGGELEDRVGIDGIGGADATHAETGRIDGLAVAHDRYRQPRNVRSLQHVGSQSVQPGDRAVDLRWRDDIGRGLRGRHGWVDGIPRFISKRGEDDKHSERRAQ